jgi:hypothetical protein
VEAKGEGIGFMLGVRGKAIGVLCEIFYFRKGSIVDILFHEMISCGS